MHRRSLLEGVGNCGARVDAFGPCVTGHVERHTHSDAVLPQLGHVRCYCAWRSLALKTSSMCIVSVRLFVIINIRLPETILTRASTLSAGEGVAKRRDGEECISKQELEQETTKCTHAQ